MSTINKFFLSPVIASVLWPIFAFAQNATPGIGNPLNVPSIEALIFKIVDIATSVGFYLAVFFIIYTGFLFVTARGDVGKLKTAKEALIWTVVGTAVLLGARVIGDVIKGTLNQIQSRHVDPQHEVTRV